MPKKDHTQEFINALKDELKNPSNVELENPHISRILDRPGRKMPPGMIINRISHLSRRNRLSPEDETWISYARLIYDFWVRENYPNDKDIPEE